MEEEITITKKEHERLKERDEFLLCLETVGVDNRDGYGEAWQMMIGES